MKSKVRLKQCKKGGNNGWVYHPYIFKIFRSLYESSFPEDLSGATSECECYLTKRVKIFSIGFHLLLPFKLIKIKDKIVLKSILSNSCTHLERCTYSIGNPGNTLNIFCSKELRKGFMARGGFREGAGRKKEYNEPVKKILLGLPESVLQQLDNYASAKKLSRPKAIAILVEQAMVEQSGSMAI